MRHARSDYDRIQDPAGLIPDDEPVLLIRGQDTLAPLMARFYALATRSTDEGSEGIARRLDQWAAVIEDWQARNHRKVADAPAAALHPRSDEYGPGCASPARRAPVGSMPEPVSHYQMRVVFTDPAHEA